MRHKSFTILNMDFLKDLVVDTIEMVCCDSYHEIIPNIYLGNKNSATNSELLNKIHLVVNCSRQLPFHSNTTSNFRVDVADDLTTRSNLQILCYVERILPEIFRCYNEEKPVLVHCRAGMHRSATVMACFLIKYFKFDKRGAIAFIKRKRKIAFFPRPHFKFALELFESKVG